jgi:hypothetical protein
MFLVYEEIIYIFIGTTLSFLCFSVFSCIHSYNRRRLEKIRDLRWDSGPVLPSGFQELLLDKEVEYFTKYNELLNEYIENFGFDISADTEVTVFLDLFSFYFIYILFPCLYIASEGFIN